MSVVAVDGAVLTVWLDTGLAEVDLVQMVALLTSRAFVHAVTSLTGRWAGLALGSQLVGPLSSGTGVLALAVLKEEAGFTLGAARGQRSTGDDRTGLTVGPTG